MTIDLMPSPTEEQLRSPEFVALWEVLKSWDVNVPEHYEGYCEANGSHVAMLLNALAVAPTTKREALALGCFSAELAARADAWNGNAPAWFPSPPEFLDLWEQALKATRKALLDGSPDTP